MKIIMLFTAILCSSCNEISENYKSSKPNHVKTNDMSHSNLISGTEIISLISGHYFETDLSVDPSVPYFKETFERDGRWLGYFRMRGPVYINGTWSIKGNQICVDSVHLSKSFSSCREVILRDDKYYISSALPGQSEKKFAIQIT